MTDMNDKLSGAGIDTATATLNSTAQAAIEKSGGDFDKAVKYFLRALEKTPTLVESLASDFLRRVSSQLNLDRQRVNDASAAPSPAVPAATESWPTPDPAPDKERSGGSLSAVAGQIASDAAAAVPPSTRGGASHELPARQQIGDRPAAPSSPPAAKPPAGTRIGRAGAVIAAGAGVFGQRIHKEVDFLIGELNLRTLLDLKIRTAGINVWVEECLKLPHPDLHTPISKWASPKDIEQIRDKAEQAEQAATSAAVSLRNALYGGRPAPIRLPE